MPAAHAQGRVDGGWILNTDKEWQRYGEVDPYFGVITHNKYHSWSLTDHAREEFFQSGEEHVERIMKALREIDPRFSPSNAVDFGCGVGRVTLPLAREAVSVLGVDVSPGMLSEAQKNASDRAISNVRFAHEVSGGFDLLHSYIVLQHIPPRRGLRILRELLSQLEQGGMVALQVPYHWHGDAWRKLASWVMRVAPITKHALNLARRRSFNYPTMMVFCYDIHSIIDIFRDVGISDMRITLDSSTGPYHSSVIIYGQRAPKG
jgi:trans-aconitate methyltransferase